jgi:hypothetical protein
MAIATTSQFWTSRLNGDDPTSPTVTRNNTVFSATGSGASASGGDWVVTDARYSQTASTGGNTLLACLSYTSVPNADEVLMAIDNGTHRVEVKASGQKVKLVGSSTTTSDDLDISMADENPVPVLLRLTLDASGNARLYMREIIEDDDAQVHYLSVTGASSSANQIAWGNNTGTVKWSSVYATTHGAFGPDELAPSDFATDTLIRMALSIVQTIRDSKRMFLKTHLDDSQIRYGFDVSSEMISRTPAPIVNVMLRGIDSPIFAALGGGEVDQSYEVLIYVITRGTNYENAFRTGLNIIGEIFDEVYTTTGLKGTTESLNEYSLELDHKMNNEHMTCVHLLTLTYDRRINMRRR